MASGDRYVERARAWIGVRFRPQGRGPARIDCIGLALNVYAVPREAVRDDYRLRGDHLAELKRAIGKHFRRVSRAGVGDLLLFRAGADQLHLAIQGDGAIVHADAGLRRVVERPGPAPWPLIAAYRRRKQD